MTGDMEGRMVWGPEIAVDGKRPEWLRDDDVMQWRFRHSSIWYGADYNTPKGYSAGEWVNTLSFIRLPADHPHYATQQPRTAPNGGEVGPEVLERMIALVRRINDRATNGQPGVLISVSLSQHLFDEARAIVTLLPEPADPIEAIVDELMRKDCTTRQAITEAVYRGRALAASTPTPRSDGE